jgi:hypothetical protein
MHVLVGECGVLPENIRTEVIKSRKIEAPAVKISLFFPGGSR